MPLDETPSSANLAKPINPVPPIARPDTGSNPREAIRLRELAAWYRDISERAGNPRIWESRLRMAEELDKEAAQLEPDDLGAAPDIAAAPAEAHALDPRTRILLEAPILPTLLRLAWPNIAVMLVMASTGLIETWWVSRLGTDALAGIALVFPLYMMMQMLSAGAMGGGISSAIARALGGGRHADADALVLHAIVLNLAIGIVCSALVLVFGPVLYRTMGGEGASLKAALNYSNIVFAGTVLVWLMNALASVIRGGGNMWVPSVWICVGVVLLVPLSPLLMFGLGPVPALGIAGAGAAVVATTALTAMALGWYIAAGRSVAHFHWARLRWASFADILRVGAVASISTFQTSLA